MSEILWRPSEDQIAAANMTAFMAAAAEEWGRDFPDYESLWRWSVARPEEFWRSVWPFCGVIGAPGGTVLENPDDMPAARFFPEAKLNFAENLLRRRDDTEAVVFWGENGARRRFTYKELYEEAARFAAALKAAGVEPGDRVAAVLPCAPESIIAMLGTAAIGAVWSSCSPDFGTEAILARFGQIRPKLLVGTDGYVYNGKRREVLSHIAGVAAAIPELTATVIAPFVEDAPDLGAVPGAVSWAEFLGTGSPEIAFERFPFDHPLYILYSSGTTGPPKCIVHGAGGTLLQHVKEHRLHCDIKPGDRVFYVTTTGWMMWNWLASALASEAAVLLYDGAPLYPEPRILFDYAAEDGMTLFGASAKYIESVMKAGLEPAETHDLKNLRMIASTGSPLSPEGFRYVYEHIKSDLCLASISGGTDIVSCFVLGNPIAPVRAGEIQTRGLGMKVEVFDDAGNPVTGEKGELVCTAPFPSQPLGFWNDDGKVKYRAAYFERFPGVWCHGDYAEITEEGGVVIHGRSDATLKPGGVRIGTAEIYREAHKIAEVVDSVAVGQEWKGDIRIVLFVRLREGVRLDAALEDRIRAQIRHGCSPRHVPAKIVQVADIPRTKSGKTVELAVRAVIHGRPVKNAGALANPESLDLFRDLAALES